MRYQLVVFEALLIGIVIGLFLAKFYIRERENSAMMLEDTKYVNQNYGPLRVGILMMATGKYASYTKAFVESARRYFLAESTWMKQTFPVTYFIFTDREQEAAQGSDIRTIYQERLGWPSDTLWRCLVYMKSTHILSQEVDYVFSLDADMLVVDRVGPEILGDLVGTLHPGFYNKPRSQFSYESYRVSKAFIPPHKGTSYFAGGVFGGKTHRVLEMCQAMNRGILHDFSKGITAVWHDESHLNRYFAMVRSPSLILGPAYCYPEEYKDTPFTPKILALLKHHEEMRKPDKI